ncbi:MAG TPA: hypothetical protein VIJ92_18400 [Ginsengibacter sp.]
MKSKWILVAASVLLAGCNKNITKYYADEEDKGLAVFSNTGNNIFTCYVNELPWRTFSRTTGGLFSGGTSELYISKQIDSSAQDLLIIQWNGFLQKYPTGYNTISLYLKVPKDFTRNDISSFQGQRFAIDSSKGYFYANISGFNTETGFGNIYFYSASFDSATQGSYSGELSGILEADFPDFKITKGRFDDQLSVSQFQF